MSALKRFNYFLIFISYILSVPWAHAESTNKSPADRREYDSFVLDNGLRVILASDPSLNQSAVALTVRTGAWADPADQQGLAHYLEHRLWMASGKYPEPNGLRRFVEAHSGETNAKTRGDTTSYFLAVTSDAFAEALDRFSAPFVAPLFSGEFADKELTAINEEWQASRRDDARVRARVDSVTANPKHPNHQFLPGNRQTLGEQPVAELIAAAQAFYRRYYRAEHMTLSLVGSQSLAQLGQQARHYFSGLPKGAGKLFVIDSPAFIQAQLGQHIHLRSHKDIDLLVLQFPIADNSGQWRGKANEHLEYLLNADEEGTLLGQLRDRGWIRSGRFAIRPIAYGNSGVADMAFDLTEQGRKQEEALVAATFAYLDQVRAYGLTDAYREELAGLLAREFNNFHMPDPLNLALNLSVTAHYKPVAHLLDHPYQYPALDLKSLKALLVQFTPENLRLWHINRDVKGDRELTYLDGHYRLSPFTDVERQAWLRVPFELALPALAQAGAETVVEVSADEQLKRPTRLIEQTGVEAWLMHSQHFQGRDGIVQIDLDSPMNLKSADHSVHTVLLLQVLAAESQRLAQRAFKRSGTRLGVLRSKRNEISLLLAGSTRRHQQYGLELLERLQSLDISKRDLERERKAFIRQFENLDSEKPITQYQHHLALALERPPLLWRDDEILKAARAATLESLLAHRQALLQNSYLRIFAFGSYNADNLRRFALKLRKALGESQQTTMTPWDLYRVAPGKRYQIEVDTKLENVALFEGFIYPEESRSVTAQLVLLNQLIQTPFFTQLRTKEELGYAVASFATSPHGHPMAVLYTESSSANLATIHSRYHKFIEAFLPALEILSPEVIEEFKASLIASLEQEPQNLMQEASPYLEDWRARNLEFNSREVMIRTLRATTKEDLIQRFKDVFMSEDRAGILVQLRGTNFAKTPFISDQEDASSVLD